MVILLIDDFGSGAYTLTDGKISPNKLWKCEYAGFGGCGVHKILSPENGRNGSCMYLYPKVNNEFTSACLVLSEKTFKDFEWTCYMRTIEQTKTDVSKRNSWETAWLMWRYTDLTHHYYLILKANGWVEVGCKDYIKVGTNQIKTPPDNFTVTVDNQDQQVFLSTSAQVPFSFKKWYKVRLVCKGFSIKIWIDDVLKVDIVDDGKTGSWLGRPKTFKPSPQMGSGKVGKYVEDAYAEYDNDKIVTVP